MKEELEPELTSNEENLEDDVFVFPTSYGQKRFWFLDQFEPGSPWYNIPSAFRLKGTFKPHLFQRAVQDIIDRHEALRTTFEPENEEPVQVVIPKLNLDIPIVDLHALAEVERETEILRRATEEARKPFDLAKGPLIRVSILFISPTDHVILLTMHHIISDGWSMGVLISEITRLYGSYLEGKQIALPDLDIQYGDYAEWQLDYLQGDILQKQIEFWKNQLTPLPAVLALPADRSRPQVQTNVGANTTIVIPGNIVKRLHTLGQQEGATLFMTLLAAFKVLLARYTGQFDISIGTPIANRTRKETEGLIGLFINTLVLRTQFYDNPSFRELLNRERTITLGAFEHQDIPFEFLVDTLQPDRDMSNPPLFQVMFILQNAPVRFNRINEDLQLEMLDIDMGTSTFDLTLSLAEGPDGISVSAEFNTDLFDLGTIDNLLRHYKNLLHNIPSLADQPVSFVPFLDKEEERKIVMEWNHSQQERNRTLCIHNLFEKQALKSPDETAVVFLNDSITYDQLNKQANQLAHYLISIGAGPEIKIGILAEKSIDLMVAVLAVLKAGAVYLPLDPGYPEDRIKYMLQDADIPLLITQEAFQHITHYFKGKVISVDGNEKTNFAIQSTANPKSRVDSENLAYMIYTSGSTGKAKGTMIRHSGLVNVYTAWEQAYNLKTKARNHLQMASFSFDVFSGDWTRALCSGGKLVLVPRDLLLEAEQLFAYIEREQVTIAEFVPAVLRNLIAYVESQNKKLDNFHCLIAGSDIWYVKEYKEFKRFTSENTRLINSFGLTEATIDTSFFESAQINLSADRLVPIGKPFNNMSMYILDANFMVLPPGVHGELYVGGESLARGYLNRPDLTAERFLPNPFSRIAGDRMYRTGDMARYLADGNVEFLGRADNQIKLRGFRIELGEIETAFAEHVDIKDTVVTLREDTPGEKRLIAYYVPESSKLPNTAELRSFLSNALPEYMVPVAFIPLDALPLTPNGKVDRRALPKPDQDVIFQDTVGKFIAPRTPVEHVLSAIFSNLLNVEQVGASHNFFLLGGHSLLATQLVSRIKDQFKVSIPLRKVFEDPTVAGIAESIEIAQANETSTTAPPIVAIERTDEMPLSFAQQRLWFLNQMEPDSPFYNIPENYRVLGPLDIDILQKSFNEIISRHEILRTTFETVDGSPRQTIHQQLALDIPVNDLSGFAENEKEIKAGDIIRLKALLAIPLDKLPLFNVEILRLSPNEHIIILIIHHIISDNWSTQIMMRELAILYDAFSRSDRSPLPPLAIQYADFAYWQRNWLKGDVLEQQIEFWKKQLADSAPLLELPTDRPRPAVQTFNGSFKTRSFSAELSEKIKTLGNEEGATLFMTLLAAFGAILHRYSGQNDLNIGTPIANRNHPEIENLVGFFVNTLVLRSKLSDNPSFRELLQRTRQQALSAYAHQDVPFEKIVEAIDPVRNMSHSPLFQVMFVLQNSQAAGGLSGVGSEITLAPIDAHSATAKFDLTLFMIEEDHHLSAALEYNTDLFDDGTIAHFLTHFENLLTAFTQFPDKALKSLSMLSEDEQQILMEQWRGPLVPAKLNENFNHIFEVQVKKNPDAVAIVFEDELFTYAQLNEKANQIAHFLLKRSITSEHTVGLALKRSPEMIMSILGILKAGAAYVPLDASYPAERLQYIINDSAIALILTSTNIQPLLPKHSANEILLDTNANEIAEMSIDNPIVSINPDQLVYMIYTSGSTGQPKGTLLTHRGLTHYLNWCLNTYPLKKGRGSLFHSTLAFDATVTALFTPLLTGKSITIIPENEDIEALATALLKYKNFSTIKLTPAHLELLANQIPAEKAKDLAHAFIIGGENLTAAQIEFWQKNAADTFLFNEYGPTETVVGCVVYEASKWRGPHSVPIGQAINNCRIYILDQEMLPVPNGVPGELYISTPAVARGYLNRPDLTAKQFIPDPFSNEPGIRMYKTGDLVKSLPDGQLEFIDRIDNQVKVRGYRIELGEIESLLKQSKSLDDAVVIVREDTPGDKRLVAYIVPAAKTKLQVTTLNKQLKNKLPEYMVPSAYVELDRIPLTANGKIDRKALPKPGHSAIAAIQKFKAPETKDEKKLAIIWQDLLHLDKVGVHDNFFELGGHSLLVSQLVSRIRDLFQVELPLKSIFEMPTISELLPEINAAEKNRTVPALVATERPEHIPLSFAQQRLWFLDQLSPENPFYNIPSAVRIHGIIDMDILEKAILEICRRHEILRTTFVENQGKPEQIINPESNFKLAFKDISALPEKEKNETLTKYIQKDASLPFNLQESPLFRARLIKENERSFVLIFNIHHIISDGWSNNILIREMALHYQGIKDNFTRTFAPLKVQYADYALWQRNWLKDSLLEEQLEFWKDAIGLNPPVLDLPTDFPRPAVQTFNGSTAKTEFSAQVAKTLQIFSSQFGVTPYMTLLAAFQAFLHRYSAQNEIFIGSPVAGRNLSETEELIGFFVNTLVLKNTFTDNLTFKELVLQTKENTLQAYAHQEIPFEQLVDQLQPERSLNYSPLFQVMFVFQNKQQGSTENHKYGNLRIEALASDSKISKFDLTLMIIELADGFAAEFEYNTDLFRSSTIEDMAKRFLLFLENLLDNPSKQIDRIPLLDLKEAHKLSDLSPINKKELEAPVLINNWFEAQVRQTPAAIAIHYQHQTLSFDELNKRANQLAHFLQSKQVGPEIFVGISLDRSPEMVIALLAVLKAGGVYVPIDPTYPEERIQYILNDANISLILTTENLQHHYSAKNLDVVLLDRHALLISGFSEDNPDYILSPENLAYMIYTSGSTGKPKGTMLSHQGLCNLTRFQIQDFQLDMSSRVLQFASFSFDASVSEIFTTLVSGASLYIADRNDLLPGPGLVKILQENKISVVTLPPSVSSLLNPEDFPELKTLISAGESCPPDIAKRWSTERRFLNAYGPTENTVCASSYHASGKLNELKVPIGTSIDNVQLYILDAGANLVPAGIPGELHIAGLSLARGYFNQPDLTADKFIPNPFSKEPGARMYKSGDLVRLNSENQIEFLGRIDQQVKIRGFRIELGEIEQVLKALPFVQNAVVMAREDVPGNRLLTAYFVPHTNEDIEDNALLNHCTAKLPGYMVPAAFVSLNQIPLTTNGKIDYRKLPKPDFSQNSVDDIFVAPRSESEQQLAEIYCEILNIEQVSITRSFFSLGGHSLLATQLSSRIRDVFGIELPLISIFEAPSIAQLTLEIEQTRSSHAGHSLPPLVAIARDQSIPLSFAQQRLWFLDQLAPDNASYNIPAAFKLIGPFNQEAFKQSLNDIVLRHESLRTTFGIENGEPVQIIKNQLNLKPQLFNLSDFSAEEREQKAQHLANEDAANPFDLEVGPLFRCTLIQLADTEHIILFNMHHIISDGWSVSLLIQEFSKLYAGYSSNNQVLLPALPVQYADYAHWQRSWLKDEILDEQIHFWKESIGIHPEPLQLAEDFSRPAVQTYNGDSVSISLNEELSRNIKRIAGEEGTTLFMFLLAAFQVLLYKYSNQETILIGSPIAGRTLSETEGIIGFFVNNLVLKADFHGGPKFRDHLQNVRNTTLQAYAHQDLPFEQLVEILQPERDMSRAPIFQVMFVMQNTPMGQLKISDVQLEAVESEQKIAKYDLSLIMMESGENLFAEFEYNTDLFREDTIKNMLDYFQNILHQITSDPDIIISRLPLADTEKMKLLNEKWNNTESSFPDQMLVHQLFEAQAKQNPQKVALFFNKETLTYDQLNQQANQLAHYLRDNGIKAEDIVGISVERSFQMIIGLLGILKAGAVYLPIDPAYPQERIEYIIEDAGLNILLTQKSIVKKFNSPQLRVFLFEELAATLNEMDNANLAPITCPSNLAYMIYTSGSTGKPKGTMLEHKGLTNLTRALAKTYRVSSTSRCLQFASFSFDASVEEIFTALTNSASLFLIDRDTLLSGTGLVNFLKDNHISNATMPPSLLSVLNPDDFPDWKNVISAGEVCPPGLANKWLDGHRFVNGYGPTENTVASTAFIQTEKSTSKSVAIGRPIANVQVYLLDSFLQEQPVDVPGEIYIGGVAIARGYLNRPDLTAERFIPNPFSAHKGQRLYRTGDLGKRLPSGDIEFLGRVDQQIKIRGFRIELAEIESVITQQTNISDAVVQKFGEQLAAYIQPQKNLVVNKEDLRKKLMKELPEYMVPSYFTLLDKIPVTVHGKVDYRALPEPDFENQDKRQKFVAPKSTLEGRLADIWQEILGRGQIGTMDNFFELGGHSLLAMRLLTSIEQQLGKDVNLVNFFQNPTISHMAKMIENEAEFESGVALIPLKKGNDNQAIYFVHPSGGAIHHYTELSQQINTERSIFGIQAQGLDGKMALHKTIEDMASAYIDAIRTKQPLGPYILASWSLGCIIVHEMARQLDQIGQKVALLIQLDQTPFIDHKKPKDNAEMLANMFQRYFKVDQAYLRTLSEDEQFKVIIKKAKKHKAIPRFIRLADFKRYILVNETQIQAWLDYTPKPYSGAMKLIRSEENQDKRDLGWGKLVDSVEIIDVPGDHIRMLQEPNVQRVARELSRLLNSLE